MKKEIEVPSGEQLAKSLILKLSERKKEIEQMRLSQLNRPLVKEWQRLKVLEKVILN